MFRFRPRILAIGLLLLTIFLWALYFLPLVGTSIGAAIVSGAEQRQKQKEAALLATPHGNLAYRFAAALVRGDYPAAHGLLTAESKAEWPAERLQSTYEQMVQYFMHPPHAAVPINDMADWQLPQRQSGDVAWVYTAIVGEGDSEAVTLVIAKEDGKLAIRSIEWGRP